MSLVFDKVLFNRADTLHAISLSTVIPGENDIFTIPPELTGIHAEFFVTSEGKECDTFYPSEIHGTQLGNKIFNIYLSRESVNFLMNCKSSLIVNGLSCKQEKECTCESIDLFRFGCKCGYKGN